MNDINMLTAATLQTIQGHTHGAQGTTHHIDPDPDTWGIQGTNHHIDPDPDTWGIQGTTHHI